MKKFNKSFWQKFVGLTLCAIILLGFGFVFQNSNRLNQILSSKPYATLPEPAKAYVEQVYVQTGEVLPTAETAIPGEPYLNPAYVDYLNLSEEEQKEEAIIPEKTVISFASTAEIETVYNALRTDESAVVSSGSTPVNTAEDKKSASAFTADFGDINLLPSAYDARNVGGKNFVSALRNQGNLNICWAVASAEVAESFILRTTNNSYSDDISPLSERQIDYAMARNSIKDYENEYVSFINRELGDGGNFFISTIAMASGTSLTSDSTFGAYDDTDLTPRELADVLNYNNSLFEVTETINMPAMNLRASTDTLSTEDTNYRTAYLNLVKYGIMAYGSAYVGTYMDSSCYHTDQSSGKVIIDHYSCSNNGGHAMQIIGWDDNLEYAYCSDNHRHTSALNGCNSIIRGKGAWLLRNSWGDYNAYPYLAYDSTGSQISFITDLNLSTSRHWDNSYITGAGAKYANNATFNFSNLRLDGTETLTAVKFIVSSVNDDFVLTIHPVSGDDITKTVHVDVSGLVTVDFPEAVEVSSASSLTITSTTGAFIDRLELFTANIDRTPKVIISALNDQTVSTLTARAYAETKNLPANSTITYQLFGEDDTDFSEQLSVSHNLIAENNINPLLTFSATLPSGNYRLVSSYNDNILDVSNFTFTNPNPTELPEDPVDPNNPNNPDNPDNPNNPEDPENPDDPNNPEDPENPDNPGNEDEPTTLSSETYKIDPENHYITKITPTTPIETYKSGFTLGENDEIIIESNYDHITTGSKTKFYHNGTLISEYINVVPGDINGDGRISSADLLRLRQHLLGSVVASGAEFEAADLVGTDHRVSSADLLRLRQHLLNINPIN